MLFTPVPPYTLHNSALPPRMNGEAAAVDLTCYEVLDDDTMDAEVELAELQHAREDVASDCGCGECCGDGELMTMTMLVDGGDMLPVHLLLSHYGCD